jgi:lipopolysaccharide/colanic/teichoic acid biosynthesis glycosyltransferase
MVMDAEVAIAAAIANADAEQEWLSVRKLTHDPRVTLVGGFLRRYSLDELPQIFNVIAGHMSLVGPRPIVAAEIPRFGASFKDYCSVKPGITGLWQTSGRHDLTYEERVLLDATYARSKCAMLDMRILLKTIPIVVFGQNR